MPVASRADHRQGHRLRLSACGIVTRLHVCRVIVQLRLTPRLRNKQEVAGASTWR